jgi:hypothetical protein
MQAALAFANENIAAPARPVLQLVPPSPGLSPAERQAVEIGRDDAFRHGWNGSAGASWKRRFLALFGRATGVTGVTPLADRRLEKLRLFASMMRRDDRRLHDTADELLADGLNPFALHQAIRIALG